MQSEITLILKDFLMDTPQGVYFELLIDDHSVDQHISQKRYPTLTYRLLSSGQHTQVTRPNGNLLATLRRQDTHKVGLVIVNQTGVRKSSTWGNLSLGNRLTLVAVSPWIKIPLSPQDTPSTDTFYAVDYQVKNQGNEVKTVKITIQDMPRKILLEALSHRGSTAWAGRNEKISLPHPTLGKTTFFKENLNKCNAFVYDVLTSIGISVALIQHGRLASLRGNSSLSPPTAGEWANENKLLNNWSTNSRPLPGDIGAYAANYSDASGHVGFVIAEGACVSAGWDKVEVNDVGFRRLNGTASSTDYDFTVFRRYRHGKPQ